MLLESLRRVCEAEGNGCYAKAQTKASSLLGIGQTVRSKYQDGSFAVINVEGAKKAVLAAAAREHSAARENSASAARGVAAAFRGAQRPVGRGRALGRGKAPRKV